MGDCFDRVNEERKFFERVKGEPEWSDTGE